MTKQLMLGNEAIARGAWEAGVRVASGYPGTPSTEIIENLVRYEGDIYAEWAPNEKVAVEVTVGAAFGGARSIACMKHMGLNVAADPLYTSSYTGVNGGLVIVVADDPGMDSSQNEQDTRLIGRAAHVPVVEPSSAGECKDFLIAAFELSEKYDTPVLFRVTTQIAHARNVVELGERNEVGVKDFSRNPKKYVTMPVNMRARHFYVEEREKRLAEDGAGLPLNRIEWGDRSVGIVTSGAAYNYVKEALPEVSVLKLGLVYPLPEKLIREFAAGVETLYVIEDMEPFYEDAIKAMGIPCSGKDRTGLEGELFAKKIATKFAGAPEAGPQATPDLPIRPPALCPGCPHRALFYMLDKMKMNISSDIGCYPLGSLPPMSGLDMVLCMGASIGMAHGFEKARGRDVARKTVAVIGDSTFCHNGVTGLMNMVWNHSTGTVVIADNYITAMTGHQANPTGGTDIYGKPAKKLDLVALCKALQVEHVRVVDPFDLAELEKILAEETAREEVSVIITKRACALRVKPEKPFSVDTEKCVKCMKCMGIGCPAIGKAGDGVEVDRIQCVGCGLCAGVCPVGALG